MNILCIKNDTGSRIPGARFEPIKYYEQSQIHSKRKDKLVSIDIANLKTNSYKEVCELFNHYKFNFALGSDHTSTYYISKIVNISSKGSCLIIFDAHVDCYEKESGKILNWNFLNFLIEDYEKIIILGERNFLDPNMKHKDIIMISSFDLVFKKDIILTMLEKELESIEKIYLSIDMDILDPSVFDSVSYPLIGGIQMIDLLFYLNKIIQTGKVFFCDIVEYNPMIGKDNAYLFFQFVQNCLLELEKCLGE